MIKARRVYFSDEEFCVTDRDASPTLITVSLMIPYLGPAVCSHESSIMSWSRPEIQHVKDENRYQSETLAESMDDVCGFEPSRREMEQTRTR